MYVTFRVCHKEITTGMTNFSNSGKVEMCGDSNAGLSYILLSANHPMARLFAFLHCYQDNKILKH